jgi:simple sugar transport system ATP-binding protein
LRLELQGITKRYGSLVANDGIDLTIEPGQIHGLLGENGAGKTTLMNVLYGLTQPDDGKIVIDGQPVTLRSPKDAITAGIGMVHQHFMLVPVFTVAENVTLGAERTRPLGLLDRRGARREVREYSERYGLRMNPDALVEDLPVGVQQRVEILKALVRNASVLILDEPTAVLTPGETEELFTIMRGLRGGGQSIVFISHKLREVQAIADTITVLRRGRVVGERPPSASDDELAALMVGRQVSLRVSKAPARPGEVVLAVRDLTVIDERHSPGGSGDHGRAAGEIASAHAAVDGVSFEVRAGEIVAIAGVQGNGQTELCEALMGLRPLAAGSVRLGERDITADSPQQRIREGIGYIPEDRQEDGLVATFSIAENIVLDVFDRPPYARGLSLDLDAIRATATARTEQFDVRATSIDTPAGTLSGGNQQKVILAREIGRDLRLLVASQPTRGLDVGSIEFVHRRIIEQRDQGVAVIIVSAELDEIYALADRIVVMYEGRITGIRPPTVPVGELGLLMTGVGQPEGGAAAAPGGPAPGGPAPGGPAPGGPAPGGPAPGGTAPGGPAPGGPAPGGPDGAGAGPAAGGIAGHGGAPGADPGEHDE